MQALFAFLAAATLALTTLTAIATPTLAQKSQIARWQFFVDRLESSVTTNLQATKAPATKAAPVVVEAKQDSFVMAWDAPSARANGTELTQADVQGYELQYSNKNTGLNESVYVKGGDITSYTFSNFESGEYLIAIAAVDLDGNKSINSSAVKVVVL